MRHKTHRVIVEITMDESSTERDAVHNVELAFSDVDLARYYSLKVKEFSRVLAQLREKGDKIDDK